MKKLILLAITALLAFQNLFAQAVFRHVTSAANTGVSGGTQAHITLLDHPRLNGNPNAIIFILPNYNLNGADAAGVDYLQNAGVWYNGSRWTIFNQNTKVAMPLSMTFNVLVAPPGNPNCFTVTATKANITAHGVPNGMQIDHPATNGKTDAMLLVTQNWSRVYNDASQLVTYANGKWSISNNGYMAYWRGETTDTRGLMPEGARFNVMVIENGQVPGFPGAQAFQHTAKKDNITNLHITFLNQSGLSGNREAILFATAYWGHADADRKNPNQAGGPYNEGPLVAWYDHPNDPWKYRDNAWSLYNGNSAQMTEGAKMFVVTVNANAAQPIPNLTGFYRADNGDCGQAYIRQNGNNIYWFGEHPNGSFGHVFSGTISGNTITGNLWDVPKGNLLNRGNCVYAVSADGNTLTRTGGSIGCNVLVKGVLPAALPASRPMQPGSGALTGIWDCNDGASTYVREDGSNFLFFSEAKNNGTRPGFANIYIGTRNGNTITGTWVDVPKGTHLGSGAMTLRVENDTRFVRADGGNGYGGSVWTRNYQINLPTNRIPVVMATLYTDCGFQGQSYRLQTGPVIIQDDVTFKLSDLNIPNNSISSIRLSKGYSATILLGNGEGSMDIVTDESCLDLYRLTNVNTIRVFKDTRLKGYADMHTHPMSHLGFGKKLMHGAPDEGSIIPAGTRNCNPTDFRARTIQEALGHCNSTHGGWGTDNGCGNYIRAVAISKAFDGDFVHNVNHDPFSGGNLHGDHRHEGIETSPSFMYWPHQTSVTHQQMWWEWLKRTYEGGLRVMVALTVNSELMAEIIDGDAPKDDKTSADLQLDEIIAFVGRHNDFMEIARTPADLRRIVGDNRMAVILGMEVDNIGNFHKPNVTCNESTVRAEIQRLYNKGVRYIFPIHLTDNRFGGAAVYEDLFNYVNRYSTGSLFSIEHSTDATINYRLGSGLDGAGNLAVKAALDAASGIPYPPAFNLFNCAIPTLGCWDKFKFIQGLLAPDARYASYTNTASGHVNSKGLTPIGEFAIREMMKFGMMVDVDHMSAKSINRTLSIAESINGGYPVNMGHNGVRIGTGSERSASTEMVQRLSALGGMLGVGTADTDPSSFVKNYNVVWYVMGSRNTAIGTDVNGFEPLPKASAGLNSNDFYRGLEKCKTGNRTWDYTKEGVAHYGLMPEFLRDARLQRDGYEMINNLMLSAEHFAQMWEKCERQKAQVR